ncbi:hypothetical protein Btru_012633 [Bulinus truncatus]|nr:hypothetical protein Btru_012633 [Bulinus truncatus]
MERQLLAPRLGDYPKTKHFVQKLRRNSIKLRQLLFVISSEPNRLTAINQRNRLGCTPLRLAATSGHLVCLNLLLEAGASVDITDVKCQTPLFVAVKNRRYECAEKLLQAKACPEGDCRNSSTPLYVAFMNRDLRCVLLLLEYGAKGSCGLFNRPEDIYKAVKALLIRGCSTENLTYHTCVYQDNEKLIELLFSFGLKTDGRDVNNRLATELNQNNQAEKKLIYLCGTPRSLLSSCRIIITSCLARPRRNLTVLDYLPLPTSVISYLKFIDL